MSLLVLSYQRVLALAGGALPGPQVLAVGLPQASRPAAQASVLALRAATVLFWPSVARVWNLGVFGRR